MMREEDREFEDFAQMQLYKWGFPIGNFSSKKFNVAFGESIGRTEIKHDKKFRDTGNLFIETQEKDKNNKWIASGIYRNDNTCFWFIGDHNTAWLISKAQLKWLCERKDENGERIYKEITTETSKGILIPIEDIESCNIDVSASFFPLVIHKFNFKK